MATTELEFTITGLETLRERLLALPVTMRKGALRRALAAGGRVFRDEAKRLTPVLRPGSVAVQRGTRKPGTVRDAISVRTSKVSVRRGNVGVFVNVRPAKGAKVKTSTRKVLGLKLKKTTVVRASQRGAKNPNDPFYWRWLEFGTRYIGARKMLQTAGANRAPQALAKIRSAFEGIVQRFQATYSKGGQP